MKTLLARILGSAADSMWQKDPTLGQYTNETAEHELNLAFHFAAELQTWFPYLDCDFDVTKANFNRERPDIIIHRRQSGVNFLVIEIKREKFRAAVPADLKKIRDDWFEGGLRYRFGAAVILDENQRTFEIQVLSRAQKNEAPFVKKQINMGAPMPRPNYARIRRRTISNAVDRLVAAKIRNPRGDVSALEQKLDELIYALYGQTPE